MVGWGATTHCHCRANLFLEGHVLALYYLPLLLYMPLSVFSLLERWGCLDAGAWRFHQKGHKSGGRTPMRRESTPLVIQPAS